MFERGHAGAQRQAGQPSQWRRVPAFVRIPPARWPLRWHVAAAFAVLATMAAAGYIWRQAQIREFRGAVHTLRQAQSELTRLRQEPQPRPAPQPELADAEAVERAVRDVGQFAAPRGVRIASVQIEYETERGPAGSQVRIVARAYGDYSPLKSWLGDLLGRYPSLAIASLTMRPTPDNRQLEAAVTLALFLKSPQ